MFTAINPNDTTVKGYHIGYDVFALEECIYSTDNRIVFCGYTTPNFNSIGENITVYIVSMEHNNNLTSAAIYDSELNLVVNGTAEEINTTTGFNWYTFEFDGEKKPALKANSVYYIAVWSGYNYYGHRVDFQCSYTGVDIYYDTLTYQHGNYTNFPNTITVDGIADNDVIMSAYINATPIHPPTDINTTIVNNNNLNITWTKGSNSDTTLIKKGIGFYPTNASNPSDGTLVYNGSDSSYVDNIIFNTYYTMWGFNLTTGLFSNATYLPFRGLRLNVYNFSDYTQEIHNFDATFTNQTGTETYLATDCDTPMYFDMNSIPTGNNIQIYLDHDNYYPNFFTLDLNASIWTNLTTYLMYDANLYYIQVVTEYDTPIYQANVEIISFLNGSYNPIASGLTDGYGLFPVYLDANATYKINISKSGYIPIVMSNLVPDPINKGIDHPIKYILQTRLFDYQNETIYWENIFFTAELDNNGLYVNFTDISGNTTDTSIDIFEINNSDNTNTFFSNFTFTDGDNEWQYTNTSINSSNCYHVILYLNHTTFGKQIEDLLICVKATITTRTIFNVLFDANYGHNPFGWSNILGFFLLVSCMFGFGQVNSGVAMMLTGFILLLVNSIIGLNIIGTLVPILFIFLAILLIWASHRRLPG